MNKEKQVVGRSRGQETVEVIQEYREEALDLNEESASGPRSLNVDTSSAYKLSGALIAELTWGTSFWSQSVCPSVCVSVSLNDFAFSKVQLYSSDLQELISNLTTSTK